MSKRFILRESHQGRITPRPDFGLFASRRKAKGAAEKLGLPVNLIFGVRRIEHGD